MQTNMTTQTTYIDTAQECAKLHQHSMNDPTSHRPPQTTYIDTAKEYSYDPPNYINTA